MRTYIIRRVLLLIPTFFLLTVLVFLSVRFLPGDAVDFMMARLAAAEGHGGMVHLDRERVERLLGLDVPAPVQYVRWLGGIFLHGTLGESLLGGFTVEERIIGRLAITVELGVLSILIGLVIAVPVGIYSAVRQDTASDYTGRSIAIIGLATPNFWLATLVLTFPAIWWAWAPPLRMVAFVDDPLRNLGHMFIPSLILGTLRWSRKNGQDVRCIRGHEEGQGDGDETTPIHSAVQSQGSDRSAARGPHDPGDRGQARSTSEPGQRLEAASAGGS